MKRLVLPCLALSFVFFATGCGDSLDSIIKDTIKLQNEASDILEDVKSKSDAEDAKPKLEKVMKKMEEMESRSKKVMKDKKPEEAIKELASAIEKHGDKAKEAESRYNKAKNALSAEAREVLKDLLK